MRVHCAPWSWSRFVAAADVAGRSAPSAGARLAVSPARRPCAVMVVMQPVFVKTTRACWLLPLNDYTLNILRCLAAAPLCVQADPAAPGIGATAAGCRAQIRQPTLHLDAGDVVHHGGAGISHRQDGVGAGDEVPADLAHFICRDVQKHGCASRSSLTTTDYPRISLSVT